MMATGKSTIGKILAKEMDFKYFDIDKQINAADYIKKKSIQDFRNREIEEMLMINSLNHNCIISTGGGIVEKLDNISILKKHYCVHLTANINIIASRIKNDTNKRPIVKLLSDGDIDIENIKNLYNTRKRHYKELASLTILTDNLSPDQISEIIKKKLLENEFIN